MYCKYGISGYDNAESDYCDSEQRNYTHDMIQRTGVFNLSVLDESAEFSLFQRFGFQSGRDTDKLEDFVCPRSENGIVYIPEMTNAYISAKVISAMDLGTHTMFPGRGDRRGCFIRSRICFLYILSVKILSRRRM